MYGDLVCEVLLTLVCRTSMLIARDTCHLRVEMGTFMAAIRARVMFHFHVRRIAFASAGCLPQFAGRLQIPFGYARNVLSNAEPRNFAVKVRMRRLTCWPLPKSAETLRRWFACW
jgi:hypothetical protein